MKPKPSLDIFKNVSTGWYSIQRYAVDQRYGFKSGYGEILNFTPSDFRERCIDIVLLDLQEFADRDLATGADDAKRSREEQRLLERETTLIGVRQDLPSQLSLVPMRRSEGGGFVGDAKEELVIILPCSSETFFEAIERAFSKANCFSPVGQT
jgi:hypothetical protein